MRRVLIALVGASLQIPALAQTPDPAPLLAWARAIATSNGTPGAGR